MYIQVVPENGGIQKNKSIDTGNTDVVIQKVENAFSACPSIGKWFSEKGNHDDLIFGLYREFNPVVLLERNVIYNCPCNEEYYINVIKNMNIEITCKNCGSTYKIDVSKLK